MPPSLFCHLLILSVITSALIIERRENGDVIYGISKRVCLKDFDNTLWKSREQNEEEGVCTCRKSHATFMVTGCYDSMNVEEQCLLHLKKPFGKISLIEPTVLDELTYYDIRFESIYGLNSKSIFKNCHANVARNNVNTSLWEKIEADFSIIDNHRVLISHAGREKLEGNILRITFACDNSKPLCTLVKVKGVTEILENTIDDVKVESTIINILKYRQEVEEPKENVVTTTKQTFTKFKTESTHFRSVPDNLTIIQNYLSNPENWSVGYKTAKTLKESLDEVVLSRLKFPDTSQSTTIQPILNNIKKNIKEHFLKNGNRHVTNAPKKMHDASLMATIKTTKQVNANSIPINLTFVYGVLLILLVGLFGVCCIIGERVYRIRQQDKLFKLQDSSLPEYARIKHDINQNIANEYYQNRAGASSNTPKILIDRGSDTEDLSDEDDVPVKTIEQHNHRFNRNSPLRLSRNLSVNLKRSRKKRLSIFDMVDPPKNEEAQNCSGSTPPLYKKTVQRKK